MGKRKEKGNDHFSEFISVVVASLITPSSFGERKESYHHLSFQFVPFFRNIRPNPFVIHLEARSQFGNH